MIFWTFVMVVVLGGLEALTCLQPLTSEAETYHSAQFRSTQRLKRLQTTTLNEGIAKSQTRLADSGRTPASKDETLLAATALDDHNSQQAVDLTLKCAGAQSRQFANGVAQVRISGTPCHNNSEFVSSEIYNEANATSATVFFPSSSRFITDYINLQPGSNNIHIIHTFKKGLTETRDFMITRASLTH
jgi:hypothetical protein